MVILVRHYSSIRAVIAIVAVMLVLVHLILFFGVFGFVCLFASGGRNGGEGGLRRACSLSDLSQPSPAQRRILPSPPNQGMTINPIYINIA